MGEVGLAREGGEGWRGRHEDSWTREAWCWFALGSGATCCQAVAANSALEYFPERNPPSSDPRETSRDLR